MHRVFTSYFLTVTDADECSTNNGGCDANADCTNTQGNFTCTCQTGYEGDGITCTGKKLVNKCRYYMQDAHQRHAFSAAYIVTNLASLTTTFILTLRMARASS